MVAKLAGVFFLVNATYVLLIWELIEPTPADELSRRVRQVMRVRSIATLGLFGLAAVIALRNPLVGLGLCCCCLVGYLRPDASGVERPIAAPPVKSAVLSAKAARICVFM